ncbi:hypothetical protein [Chthonobacter albigriseus]|uniref:hypothetical protein n=1 Tax=Chthonobacter albigriseus TaxID=1683161 RepID=UPI0015EE4BC2|nr:hypothetical protein [Chthonobacter albigriseus]
MFEEQARKAEHCQALIAVAGDPAIDSFQEEVREQITNPTSQENWHREVGFRRYRLGGGVLLLGHLLKACAERAGLSIAVSTPQFELPDRFDAPVKIIRSLAYLVRRETVIDGKLQNRWFASQFAGFSRSATPSSNKGIEKTLRGVDTDGREPDVVVIDDAGNGFRDDPELWPDWLRKPGAHSCFLAVLKINRPFRTESPLFQSFTSYPAANRIVVVNGYDLRDDGHDISRRLSWERTTADLARYATKEPFSQLSNGGQHTVVVRLGLEGTGILSNGEVQLIAEPSAIEDDLEAGSGAQMSGKTSAFTAGLVVAALRGKLNSPDLDVAQCVEAGMNAALSYRLNGYVVESGPEPKLTIPPPANETAGFRPQSDRSRFVRNYQTDAAVTALWPTHYRATATTGHDIQALAKRVVREGEGPLRPYLRARFGGLVVTDWREVETFRYVDNLIRKYIAGQQATPLSLAVFGAPGSGKSFGVKEIARSFSKKQLKPDIAIFEFNVAQWSSQRDLTMALHRIRDEAIAGKMPLAFFDEFDGNCRNWLKLFLAPMQDGTFRDEAQDHTIGRAIFIFAGGTAKSYREFTAPLEDSKTEKELRDAKAPDFISRLSGSVDIRGIDRPDDAEMDDGSWQIRRALILRSLLSRQFKKVFDQDGVADIDEPVLDGLLGVPRFKHGTRSLEAILRMSSADAETTHFGLSELPPDDQLKLHVATGELLSAIRGELKTLS